jgi:hypothetical protein
MKRKGFLLALSEEDKKLIAEFGKMRSWSASKTIRICMRAAILAATAKAINLEAAMQKAVYMENGEKE